MSPLINRRQFLAGAGAALGSLALGPPVLASASPENTPSDFPLLEVNGSHYEVGRAIGKQFGEQIKKGLERRKAWFERLRTFMQQDLKNRYEPFWAAGKKYFPQIARELQGWADGSGIDFLDLFALTIKAELSAMMNKLPSASQECSTAVLSHKKRLLIAHNEDGNDAYADLMFLTRASIPGKPSFFCLTYPGILCGNAPAINSAGLVLTTNYIGGRAVRHGVPRYFLSRAILEAESLKEAVEIATHPERAFCFHYNLGSIPEKKILSVETSVEHYGLHEVRGLYVHTNHMVLGSMLDTPQDETYRAKSLPRYRAMNEQAKEAGKNLDTVDAATLWKMLSSHRYSPRSPCRHPQGKIHDATLATALFDLSGKGMQLGRGNPCMSKPVTHRPFAF